MTTQRIDHTAIDGAFVARRSPAVFTVEIDGEAVLFDEAEERLHHLNPTATLVWSCLDGDATAAEVAADLSAEIGIPEATVLADTVGVLRELGACGLLLGVRSTSLEAQTWT